MKSPTIWIIWDVPSGKFILMDGKVFVYLTSNTINMISSFWVHYPENFHVIHLRKTNIKRDYTTYIT